MKSGLSVIFICSLLLVTNAQDHDFPESFKFGVGTAAFQIEGGWDEDGKGPSIWDVGLHEHPEKIPDGTNGDIADDSYHQIDRDVEMLKELGVDFYRFSISWPRVLPNGEISSLNAPGIEYYNNLINKLLANSIEPMVTMYHWDLPYELQKIGGITNPNFPKYFEQYANVLYYNFGDRVKKWATFNEPTVYCLDGYGSGGSAPFVNAQGIGDYLCIDHTLKAHALAYRLYDRDYRRRQKGQVGIVLNSGFSFSKTNDTEIVDRAVNFYLGWLAHPIFSKTGGYPDVMVQEVALNSQLEGRAWSRLPVMDGYWKSYIQGTADFFGLNYYSSSYAELAPRTYTKHPSYWSDARIDSSVDPSWKRAKSSWLYHVPEGLGGLLRWIKKEYDNVEVYITENGWSDEGELTDEGRIDYLKDHLREVSMAIADGCNVTRYTHWSLMDNLEWMMGYTERFGLYYVDITNPKRTRIPKKSVSVYKDIIATRKIE